MISYLKGILTEKEQEEIVVDVNGIGYSVLIPLTTYEKLPVENVPIKIFTYLHIRENIQQLYGFLSVEERNLFLHLLDVPDIGPRTAISILSHTQPLMFKQAVLEKNLHFLTSLPGVGKKTAEKIVLELKDKIKDLAVGEKIRGTEISTQAITDAIDGLVSLGYRESQARIVVEQIARAIVNSGQNLKTEDLVTQSLRQLSKI